LKANITDVNNSLNLKANISDVNNSLALKANSSDLTTTTNNLTTLQNDHNVTRSDISWLIGTANANWANINNILLPDNTTNKTNITNLQSNLTSANTQISLKQNISDMENYYTKNQSDSRFVLPSRNTEQNIPYLSTTQLKTSTNESSSTIFHASNNLDFSYFNILTIYSPTGIMGNKVSIEILGGAFPYLQTNVNEQEKLVLDISILDNNPSFASLPNIVSTHYIIGNNEDPHTWVADILLLRNGETGFADGFSWHLIMRLRLGTYPTFVKCSTGTTIRHNNQNMGFNNPINLVPQNRWFRSIHRFSVKSETTFFNKVILNHRSNNIRFIDKIACYVLDGIVSSGSFNKYPIICSERNLGSNIRDLADALILMPGYAVVLYVNIDYSGLSYPIVNGITNTNPMFVDLSNMANTGDVFNNIPSTTANRNAVNNIASVRLYAHESSSYSEITIDGLS